MKATGQTNLTLGLLFLFIALHTALLRLSLTKKIIHTAFIYFKVPQRLTC